MRSALLCIMVNYGWRLGLPIAVVIEKVINGQRAITNSFVCYITDADHEHVLFKNKDTTEEYLVQLLPNKELVVPDSDERQWKIVMSHGQESVVIYLGQNVSFAKRALAVKQQLALAKIGMPVH